jgi:HEAT repeat protein
MEWIQIVSLMTGVAGATVLAAALYANRSRGRRRCPTCWFDMSGTTGLKCPECGKQHRHEGRMYLTRRHIWWATLGALVLVSARVGWEWPDLRRRGTASYVPTRVLVWVMPYSDSLGKGWPEELEKRLSSKTPKDEWEVIIRRAIEVLADTEALPAARARAANLLRDIEGPRFFVNSQGTDWENRIGVTSVDAPGVARAITEAIADADKQVSAAAASAATEMRDNAMALALPRLLAGLAGAPSIAAPNATGVNALLDTPEPVREVLIDNLDHPLPASMHALAVLGADATPAETIAAYGPLLRDADWRVRVLAAWGMSFVEGVDREKIAAELLHDQRADVQAMAGWMIGGGATSHETRLRIAKEMLQSPASGVVAQGIELAVSLGAQGHDASALIEPLLDRVLNDPAWYVRRNAGLALVDIKAGAERLHAAAIAMIRDPQPDVGMSIDPLLKALGSGARSLAPVWVERIATRSIGASARMMAIVKLNEIAPGHPDAYDTLLAISRDKSDVIQVRYQALKALGEFGDRAGELKPVLEPMLGSEEELERRGSREALAKLNVAAAPSNASDHNADQPDEPDAAPRPE